MTNNTMINYVYNSSGKNEALKKRYRENQIWIEEQKIVVKLPDMRS